MNNRDNNTSASTIVIIGGVAGGASAATRARRINEHANIILLEKDGYVSFANCGLPYYIGGEIQQREKLLVAKPELLINRYNIDVRVHNKATAIDKLNKQITVENTQTGETYTLPYNQLILSPGARPIVPPIPGIETENVYTLRNVEDTDRIKSFLDLNPNIKHITVVGAGFIGLEMVEQLHNLNIAVTLIELQPQVLPLLDPDFAIMLEDELTQNNIDVLTGDGLQTINPDEQNKIASVTLNSGKTIDTDMVLLGIGVAPNNELATDANIPIGDRGGIKTNLKHQTADPAIYAVGDVAEYVYKPTNQTMRVPLAGPANRAGRIAGTYAASYNPDNEKRYTPHDAHKLDMSPVLGTSAVRVFSLTAAMTGLSLKMARNTDQNIASVTVTANHHVGYYPGATPITLKLVYNADTGLILGAQAIGKNAVDKRIDVIATLMHMNGTVHDLIGLDLVYAPPFGAAKDIVHQAGFAATNQLNNIVNVIQPDEISSEMQILDVRTDSEHAANQIPSSLHIPLDDLRNRIDELNADITYAVICGSGLRSYIATRILTQRGIENVHNVSGGMTSWLRHQKAAKPQQATV
ncbi:Coenzyme A disulfide reductase [Poriferisphaera corsica]|uniref:Coenzyme A disulfide reductase n=1 Tax=Poriferisphaera corsica TaxID=2528020 RepID=A0A517YUW0_9BACT|nr:FAD-dependent oxidoreductase [Poriferisphaera corsica]QDU33942.1 Coenzyme A disulfide reductase [Poriferisphaera corsica]